jgi:hypothetical protein
MADTPKLYRIVNWADTYENNESRRLKTLLWVPMPNKHDGLGFKRMAMQRNRCELFAAWMLLVQLASKGRPEQRGTLARDGLPLDVEDMALMTGFPRDVFERALAFFSEPKVGWLTHDAPGGASALSASPPAHAGDSPDKPAQSPDASGDAPDASGSSPTTGRKEGMKTGREGNPPASPAPPDGKEESDDEWIARLRRECPRIDIEQEIAAAEGHQRKSGKVVERGWFERVWLPKCSPAVKRGRRPAIELAAPDGWDQWLANTYPHKAGAAWNVLPRSVQDEARRALERKSA